MFVNKLKVLVAVLIVGGTLGVGTGRLTYTALAQDPNGLSSSSASRTDEGNQQPDANPRTPRSDLERAMAEVERAQLDLQKIKTDLEKRHVELEVRRAHLAEKMAALERAHVDRVLRRDENARLRAITPQERLSQLERKLAEALHEVQALRSQMEAGQEGKTRINPEDRRPKADSPQGKQ